jgi:hypothetical protein
MVIIKEQIEKESPLTHSEGRLLLIIGGLKSDGEFKHEATTGACILAVKREFAT